MHVEATYSIVHYFDVPEGVSLLSRDSNDSAKPGTIGRWCVRYAVLHYIDKDGNTCEIEGTEGECDKKWPDKERLVQDYAEDKSVCSVYPDTDSDEDNMSDRYMSIFVTEGFLISILLPYL